MKKCFAMLGFLLITYSVLSQEIIKNREYYLTKSKKQKTAAWILLSAGVVTSFVGSTQWSFAGYDDSDADKQKIGSVLIFTGLAAMVASVPFFITSAKNKRKAAGSVSFKMEKATIVSQAAVSNNQYPAVTMLLRF